MNVRNSFLSNYSISKTVKFKSIPQTNFGENEIIKKKILKNEGCRFVISWTHLHFCIQY